MDHWDAIMIAACAVVFIANVIVLTLKAEREDRENEERWRAYLRGFER